MLQRQRTDSGIIHLYIGPCGDPADRRMTIMGRPGARGVQCESHVATHLLGPPRCCLTHVGSSPAFCGTGRSEEHTSELQSLMRISYAVFCLKKKNLE